MRVCICVYPCAFLVLFFTSLFVGPFPFLSRRLFRNVVCSFCLFFSVDKERGVEPVSSKGTYWWWKGGDAFGYFALPTPLPGVPERGENGGRKQIMTKPIARFLVALAQCSLTPNIVSCTVVVVCTVRLSCRGARWLGPEGVESKSVAGG